MTISATFSFCNGEGEQTRTGLADIARHASEMPYNGWKLINATGDDKYTPEDIQHILDNSNMAADDLGVRDTDDKEAWTRVAYAAIGYGRSW